MRSARRRQIRVVLRAFEDRIALRIVTRDREIERNALIPPAPIVPDRGPRPRLGMRHIDHGTTHVVSKALGEFAHKAQGLTLRGLQCYAGHVMHIEAFADRREQSLVAMKLLGETRDAFRARGLPTDIVSGGGTGSFDSDPEAKVLTELQGGSYVFMDKQYNDVHGGNGATMPFATSLFVQMSVVSNNTKGLATTDAGFKAFATDAGSPAIFSGAPEGANYFFFGDEQGGIFYPSANGKLDVGAVINCIVPHCDPTVNLYDRYHCVRGDVLESIWTIEARGCSA